MCLLGLIFMRQKSEVLSWSKPFNLYENLPVKQQKSAMINDRVHAFFS